jgi:phospholipid/cholesterol/gamma-HCH transport system ATP-binding protein
LVKKLNIKQTNKIIIKVRNLSKKFDKNIVLEDINFDLYEGESLAIIGASGSGKSVLLKNIIGLLKPDKGSIKINNVETVNLSRSKKEDLLLDLGITFQHGALFDSLKVWENIVFKIQRLKKLSIKDGQKIALDIIKNLGLKPEVLNLYPSEISGGMQKRVAIARAICSRPKILLFDEPTSGLDPVTGSIIDELIVNSVKSLGASAITITHDMASVSRIADKIILIDQQKISWAGKPEEMLKSDNLKIQQFIKAINPTLFK